MGLYTSEEHAKRELVVREPHLNRAYAYLVFCLAEHLDPDGGRKKWTRVPEECDVMGLIAVRPLRSIGSGGVDGPSCVRVDGVERLVKQVAHGTPKLVARARSSSPSLVEPWGPSRRRLGRGGDLVWYSGPTPRGVLRQ